MIPCNTIQHFAWLGIASLFGLIGSATDGFAQGTGKHWGTNADFIYNVSSYGNMETGREAPDPKVLDAASKKFVWIITWPDHKKIPKNMNRALTRFVSQINSALRNKDKNEKFRQILGEKLSTRFGEIFSQPVMENRIAAINACRVMPYMGKLDSTAVMDFFISLMKDPKQHEIVKMAAMRGMQYFPRADTWTPLHNEKIKSQVVIKQRSLDRVAVLMTYVNGKAKLPANPTKPQTDAVRFIRREAIKALGAVRAPAINVETNTKKIEGIVVIGLLQVAAGQVSPPPLLSEKLEAAIGLCQMQRGTNDNTTYRYEPSLYLIGKTLLELIDAYREDQPGLNVGGALGKPALLPYKIVSSRVGTALETLVANTKGVEGSSVKAQQLQKLCERMLGDMSRHKAIDSGARNTLIDFVASLAPQNTEIWAGIKKTAVVSPN